MNCTYSSQIQVLLEGGELMEDGGGDLPSDPEQLQAVIEDVEERVVALQGSIVQEEAKIEKYKVWGREKGGDEGREGGEEIGTDGWGEGVSE